MKTLFCLLLLFLILIGCSTVPTGFEKIDQDELTEKIHKVFEDTLFSHAHWGVLIKSLTTGETIYGRNSNRMFMPASNQKIITAAVALTELGPDYKYETTISHSGKMIDSVIHGDLIITGNGDPTLSDRIYEKPTSVFELWADSLLTLGIDSISGNIIGDDNKFDDNNIGYGWPHSGLSYWYSAEFGALQLNENYVDFNFFPPNENSDSLIIIPDVKSNYYTVINNLEIVDTGKTEIDITRKYETNNILMGGKILKGSKSFERSPTITNPTKFYVTVLKEVFEEKGIKVGGNPIDCDDIPSFQDSVLVLDTLLVHQSMPLSEILKVLMKKSQNLYAETTIRSLGLNASGIGSFSEGKKVVENTLMSFGIEPNTYAFRDGSGLTRYNFISPKQIVTILENMRESKYWNVWYDIQPIAGVDGTLKWRMKETKAENNVRAKTGTISNVRGLSGYVKTSNNEEIVFSFLVNGHLKSSRDTELITDKVLEILSSYPIVDVQLWYN